MIEKHYTEYVVMLQDKELRKYSEVWDVLPSLPIGQVMQFLEHEATKQAFEITGLAKASKTVTYNEESDEYTTVYTSAFEQVDIYEVHPPKRFRDIGNAE